jgi:hypothetical protein
MPTKDKNDPVVFAHSVLDQLIAKHDPEVAREQGKDPKAVALGKRGGAKGGHARAQNLTEKRRKTIAKKAIRTRWNKKPAKS